MQIRIARIYVKDLSFESPGAPKIFDKNVRPELGLNVAVRSNKMEGNFHEVSLVITVEAKEKENVVFIVEVEQAGVFEVEAPDQEQLDRILRLFCPSTLFPYARQVIDQSMMQGGFPPLMLAPINFESLLNQPEK